MWLLLYRKYAELVAGGGGSLVDEMAEEEWELMEEAWGRKIVSKEQVTNEVNKNCFCEKVAS